MSPTTESNLSSTIRKQKKHPILTMCAASVLITAGIVLFSYVILGFVPFSDKSLVYKDGQQQLIDLFCWFKDVLSGKSSIDYTFTKYLGGSNFAVFSYYLASPLNLLVVFFDKAQMPLFMNVLFLLKASLAALTACYYLQRRFHPTTKLRTVVTVLLSVSYALSQYLIAQSSVIMWLDGAIMLPLILSGVESIIHEKRHARFIISAACALIFNWYTGIIDLLFSGLWFLFESARVFMTVSDQTSTVTTSEEHSVERNTHPGKEFVISILRYGGSALCALLLSSCLLLPTLSSLSGRTYGSSGLRMLTDFSMIGFLPNVISNYSLGLPSVKGGVNLFAGSFVLIGVALLFLASSKVLKEKLLYGVFLITVILSFYFQPFVALFSMLREVDSLWYRYSYVGSFALIYLAAIFYLDSKYEKLKAWMPVMVAAVFSIIAFLMTDPNSTLVAENILVYNMNSVLHTQADAYLLLLFSRILFPILVSLLICLAIYSRHKHASSFRSVAMVLAFISLFELAFSQIMLGSAYSTSDSPYLSTYTENEIELLDRIEDQDFFRIVQTSTHSTYHSLPASYNEPMAYGFPSVSSFVSAPDENTVHFLDQAGYPGYYDTIPVTASENLALDSLLSVRYVLLPYNDTNNIGLTPVDSIEGFKTLYENAYAAPMAFVIPTQESETTHQDDPAQYLNDIYRRFTSIDRDIFVPVPTTIDGRDIHADVSAFEDSLLYMNIYTNDTNGATLYMNGEAYTSYATAMAPTMIRVLPKDGQVSVTLDFSSSDDTVQITDTKLYRLDLDVLEQATCKMKACAAKADIQDGRCTFEVDHATSGQSLFASIPDTKGWQVTRNGKKIDYTLSENTFITIPLEEGHNIIKMTYTTPNKTIGIILSVVGVILLGSIVFLERRKPGMSATKAV